MTKSSKVGEFSLSLREGYMFPFQNATSGKVNNTEGLKDLGIELHVLPSCSEQNCVAEGQYINDNSHHRTLEGYTNNLTFSYFQDFQLDPDTLVIQFEQHANASEYLNNIVNSCDLLSNVQIYNAGAMDVDNTYSVTATMTDGSVQTLPNTASYVAGSDRLNLNVDTSSKHIWMPMVRTLTFIKNA